MMETVYSFTANQMWTALIGFCAAIVTISAAVTAIGKLVVKIKSPNDKQNQAIEDHEKRLTQLEKTAPIIIESKKRIDALNYKLERYKLSLESYKLKLESFEKHIRKIDDGNNVIMKSLLALLSHGLDGNSVEEMKEAKQMVQDYLIHGINGGDNN